MLDIGYDFKQINPNWFDTMRVDQAALLRERVRRGRQHVRRRPADRASACGASTPTALGELKTHVRVRAVRHRRRRRARRPSACATPTASSARSARASTGARSWTSTSSPTRIEYWGPTGMVFFRNVQVRWMPIKGDSQLTLALERPGASADQRHLRRPHRARGRHRRASRCPTSPANYRKGGDWGYVEAAGILRQMKWDDTERRRRSTSPASATGWGINLSSNLKVTEQRRRSACSSCSARASRTT